MLANSVSHEFALLFILNLIWKMEHLNLKSRGKRPFLASFFFSFLILSASHSFAQQAIDCCDQTTNYNPPPNEIGWYLCLSKSVPVGYGCTGCSTAVNCKWLHFSNTSYIVSGSPSMIVEKCCYTKFKLRITKDANSSSFIFCYVSNNWDCKQGCDNAWTIKDVTHGQPGSTVTEGACTS
jgi:hypothetical protein